MDRRTFITIGGASVGGLAIGALAWNYGFKSPSDEKNEPRSSQNGKGSTGMEQNVIEGENFNAMYVNRTLDVDNLQDSVSSLESVLDNSAVANLSSEESEENLLDNIVEVTIADNIPVDPQETPFPGALSASRRKELSRGFGLQVTTDGFVLVPYNIIQPFENDWKGGNEKTPGINREYKVHKQGGGKRSEYDIDTSFWAVNPAYNMALIKAKISDENPRRSYFKIDDGEVVRGEKVRLFSFEGFTNLDPYDFDSTVSFPSYDVRPPSGLSEEHEFLQDLFLVRNSGLRNAVFTNSDGAFIGLPSLIVNKSGESYQGGTKVGHAISLIRDSVKALRSYDKK